MPRSGSGTYSLPSGNPVVTGTTIEATWANNTLSDIATAMTDSLSRSGQGGMTAAFRAADGTSSVPGVSFSNETTTGLYRAGSADMRLSVTTTQVQQWLSTGSAISGTFSASGNVSFDGGSFVFNEAGADKDARFEGDTDANLLVTDASTDRIGIGTASPSEKLDVRGNLYLNNTNGYVYIDNGGAGGASLKLGVNGTSDAYVYAVESDPLIFGTGNTERFRIGTAGQLGIGGATYGTSGQALVSQGASSAPVWSDVVTPTGTQTLTNKTFTGYTETVHTLATSGTIALNPANGTMQTCAAAGTVTFTDSLAAGQSLLLMLTGGSTYTINWPTVTWVTGIGNVAPTRTNSDTYAFWKIGTTLYATYVGSYA